MNIHRTTLIGIAACSILALVQPAFAQEMSAVKAAPAGKPVSSPTIPLSSYTITATKNNKRQTGTLAGSSPFASTLTSTTIPVVVVPAVVSIGSTFFDPTAANTCDGGFSAVYRLMNSPLVQPVPNLTFNGINVGNVQYVDGFMRAEFWNTIKGSPAYTNEFAFTVAPPVSMVAGTNGFIDTSGCGAMGIVPESFMNTQFASFLQSLTASGTIATNQIVLFLTANVTSSHGTPGPWAAGCCTPGWHSATGSAPQVWAYADYDTTGIMKARNTTVVAHELAEIMNDPTLVNSTPAWGGVGDVPSGSCQGNLEVGDPLVGTQITITQNGYTYNLVELAFFSWFFDSPSTASLGAGGMFSSNGTFKGPSMPCPPGGTY
jgi:hypothetical protein